jgi:hypothetical protein
MSVSMLGLIVLVLLAVGAIGVVVALAIVFSTTKRK